MELSSTDYSDIENIQINQWGRLRAILSRPDGDFAMAHCCIDELYACAKVAAAGGDSGTCSEFNQLALVGREMIETEIERREHDCRSVWSGRLVA